MKHRRADPAGRFTGRVEHYARYRPGYPRAIVDQLVSAGWLQAADTVADIGSGTGKLSELFLAAGCRVIGVEPNREMREMAERALRGQDRFRSVAGRAERTTLRDASVQVVAAGQSFHWFDPGPASEEFRRILVPDGLIVLIWNIRSAAASPFMAAYERLLLDHCLEKGIIGRCVDEAAIASFFTAGIPDRFSVRHHQVFDREGLEGRLVSTSYMPVPTDEGYPAMIAALDDLFRDHEQGGMIRFEYETRAYVGRLQPL